MEHKITNVMEYMIEIYKDVVRANREWLFTTYKNQRKFKEIIKQCV